MLRDRTDGELWIVSRGASMKPRLPSGSRLLVRSSERAPRTGEVWVFVAASGDVIAHRFLCTRRGQLVFFGDNECRSDPHVDVDALVGRVVEFEVAGGRRSVVRRSMSPVLAMVGRALARRARMVGPSRRDCHDASLDGDMK